MKAKEEKLTLEPVRRVVRGVDTVEAEEALRLQDEHQRAPSKQHAAEAQALQQARGQGEDVPHPHGERFTSKCTKINVKKNTFQKQFPQDEATIRLDRDFSL